MQLRSHMSRTHACDQGTGYMTRGLGSVRWFCCLVSSLLSPRPISPPPPALPPILPPSLPDSVPQSLLLTSLHPSLRPFPTLSVMQGCKNRASFGSHRAEWCSLHRAPHDTNKRLASCTFAGCLKQASFQNTYICMRVCMCELGAVHAT